MVLPASNGRGRRCFLEDHDGIIVPVLWCSVSEGVIEAFAMRAKMVCHSSGCVLCFRWLVLTMREMWWGLKDANSAANDPDTPYAVSIFR